MSESLNSDQQQQLLFMMLLQQHEQIAMMGMGKIKSPMSDKIERDLKSAKYAIDTLVMLEKFTSGNLSRELSGYLTQMLNNLRLNYADERKKDAVAAPKTGDSPKKEEGAKSVPGSKNGGDTENEESPKSGGSSKIDDSPKKGGASGGDRSKDGDSKKGVSSKSESSKKEEGSKSSSPKNGDTPKKEDK